MAYQGDLSDFIDYEGDSKEQGQDTAAQAGAITSATLAMKGGTIPQGFTGIKYWDEKEEITPYDAYLAKKYNDITFTGRLDINANTKTQSVTKLMGDISQDLTSLANAEQYLALGKDNAGFFSGLSRKLNKWSGGIWSVSDDNARYQNLGQRVLYDTTKAQIGGRPSNAAIQDARAGFGGEFQSAKEQAKRTGESMGVILNGLEAKMDQLERQGQNIPPQLIKQWEYYKGLSDNAKLQKDFNYNKYIENNYKRGANTSTLQNTSNNPYAIEPYIKKDIK